MVKEKNRIQDKPKKGILFSFFLNSYATNLRIYPPNRGVPLFGNPQNSPYPQSSPPYLEVPLNMEVRK